MDSPLNLNIFAWFILMSHYPYLFGLYLYNILTYGTLVCYEGLKTLIISKNLSSPLFDLTIIHTKLQNNLVFYQVKKIIKDWPFICYPLKLILKPRE